MTEKQSAPRPNRRSLLSGAAAIGVFSLLKAARAEVGQNATSGPVNAPAAPRPITDTEDQRLSDLVSGNHILFDQGVNDDSGHLSVRSIKDPTRFFMSQSRAPGLVARDDIMEFDLDSNPLDQRGRRMYSERYIHSEIYRARPDVQSVIHSHTPAVIPFGVTGIALRPLFVTACFLPQTVPTFEIRDVVGLNNGAAISNKTLGAALAKALGNSPVVLMRGHGMTVVGPGVRYAVDRALQTKLNAEIQLQAMTISPGKITFVDPMETANCPGDNDKLNGLEIGDARRWDLWVAMARADRAWQFGECAAAR